jgi:hypothetical protein
MVKCIRLCLDRTDICTATLGVVSRQTEYDAAVTRPLLEACVTTCKSCGDECERHSRQRAFGRVRGPPVRSFASAPARQPARAGRPGAFGPPVGVGASSEPVKPAATRSASPLASASMSSSATSAPSPSPSPLGT